MAGNQWRYDPTRLEIIKEASDGRIKLYAEAAFECEKPFEDAWRTQTIPEACKNHF
jgi:hypothetical protein